MPETDTTPRVLGEGRFLRLAAKGRWEYAERINCSGAVAIVAVTAERELLLVEQYREAVGAWIVELPAGLVGDDDGGADDSLTLAARRELQEEVGYDASHVEELACGTTTPGLATEQITIAKATELTRVGEGGGIEGEEIRVHRVPLDGLRAWLKAKEGGGCIVDLKLYAGLFLAGLAGEVT